MPYLELWECQDNTNHMAVLKINNSAVESRRTALRCHFWNDLVYDLWIQLPPCCKTGLHILNKSTENSEQSGPDQINILFTHWTNLTISKNALQTLHDTPPLQGNKTCREDGCS